MAKIILASASPRRQELIAHITNDFVVITKDTDETVSGDMSPTDAVKLIAKRKAMAVYVENPENIVIGADTIVVLDGEIMGKPKNNTDAENMLHKLSGKTHTVYTGVHIVGKELEENLICGTEVLFETLTHEEILEYIATGEPMDKAGAYGIQGYGSKFVREIRGDFFNVMGFPINMIYQTMKTLKKL